MKTSERAMSRTIACSATTILRGHALDEKQYLHTWGLVSNGTVMLSFA